jgi:hypothetical protein
MIRHHPEASLAPCDHPMWIIWWHDRHHHALTAHRKARKRGRWSGTRLPAQSSSGAATCRRDSSTHLLAQGSSEGVTCPRGSSSDLPAQGSSGAPRVPAAPAPTSRLRAAPGVPRVA